MEFKDRFLTLRKSKNIGQLKLAKDLEISSATISFWETGRNEPTLQMLKKIATYFNVTTDYLIGLEDEYGNKIVIPTEEQKDKTITIAARGTGKRTIKLTEEQIATLQNIVKEFETQKK